SQSRQEFISANLSWLGNRGNKVYDLALGQAEYIRRLFRKNKTTSHVKNTLQATQSGATIKNNTCRLNEQGLMQNGPTWQNQFGEDWKTYC
ncbi:Tc toxin subunit A, partial [Escherichia coli]|uniref:Tc toxin subunit A n=2 Tax=Enterobacteriaceae TaxID=543 RepID=UPI001324FC44